MADTPSFGEFMQSRDVPSFGDFLAQRKNVTVGTETERAAGIANPGISPQPLAAEMKKKGKAYIASRDPQERYLLHHPEQRERVESGSSLAIPIAIASLGTTAPISTIAEKGLIKYAAPLVKAGVKSFAGAEAGHYLGSKISPTMGTVGGVVGGIGGPFVSGQTFAKLPFGLGHMVATDEEYAALKAAQKVAQRKADIAAGLRKPPPASSPMVTGTPTSSVIGNEPLPVPTGKVAATTGKPAVVTPSWVKEEVPAPSKIITKDFPPKFTGNEGRPATWTNEAVLEEAAKGNREAISQVVRRHLQMPENARYVAGDPSYSTGVYNPRDVTKFTPEGIPIRQQMPPKAMSGEYNIPTVGQSKLAATQPSVTPNPTTRFPSGAAALNRAKELQSQGMSSNESWRQVLREDSGVASSTLSRELSKHGINFPIKATPELIRKIETALKSPKYRDMFADEQKSFIRNLLGMKGKK